MYLPNVFDLLLEIIRTEGLQRKKYHDVSLFVWLSPVPGAASPEASEHLCGLKQGDLIYLGALHLGCCILCRQDILLSNRRETNAFRNRKA